jgi:hypothetical protein
MPESNFEKWNKKLKELWTIITCPNLVLVNISVRENLYHFLEG